MSANYDNTSPLYHVRRWRNVPEAEEAALEDFLAWLEYDDQSPDIGPDELKDIKALVNAYLGRNPDVPVGEKMLLTNWIKAVSGS